MLAVVLLVLFSNWVTSCWSFRLLSSTAGSRSQWLTMKGSLEDQKFSKKALFRKIRDQLNEAAKDPKFFLEEGETKPLELYSLSDNSGKQSGACPKSQFLQLVLVKKGVSFNMNPIHPQRTPQWIESEFGGRLPLLVHEQKILSDDVLQIAEYIDRQFPQNSLTRQGVRSYQEVLESTASFFPAVTECVLNRDSDKSEALRQRVEDEFTNLESILESTPGRFLGGIEMTLADYFLLPQLFHAMVGLDHFQNFEAIAIDRDSPRPVLDDYISRMLDLQEFNSKKVYCSVDKVIFHWKVLRGEAQYAEKDKTSTVQYALHR